MFFSYICIAAIIVVVSKPTWIYVIFLQTRSKNSLIGQETTELVTVRWSWLS